MFLRFITIYHCQKRIDELCSLQKTQGAAAPFPHFAYRLNKREGMYCTLSVWGFTLWLAGCHEPQDAKSCPRRV
jgi:hypothetical protein